MTPAERKMVRNFLLFGGAAGASMGAGTVLLHQLKLMAEKAQDKRQYDDDVLYVTLPEDKQEKAATMTATTLGVLGGTLSGAAAYLLVRKAYAKMRQKQLQDELDDSQGVYLTQLGELASADKKASTRSPTIGDAFASSPLLVPASAGLASALLSYMLLKRYMPDKVELRNAGMPASRVFFREAPDRRRVEEDEAKEAAWAEWLLLDTACLSKAAARSDTGFTEDLLSAVADGRIGELRDAFQTGGPDLIFEITKGASNFAHEAGDDRWVIAAHILQQDPLLGPSAVITAAAERADLTPAMFKLAAAIPEQHRDRFVAAVPASLLSARRALVSEAHCKQAAQGSGPMGGTADPALLERFLSQGNVRKQKSVKGSLSGEDLDNGQSDMKSRSDAEEGDEIDEMMHSDLAKIVKRKAS